MNLMILIFHISYFILPGSGKNEICNGMPGKYIGSFQGILNDTLKLQMYLPVGNWASTQGRTGRRGRRPLHAAIFIGAFNLCRVGRDSVW